MNTKKNTNQKIIECILSHEPNEKTIRAIKDAKNRKNIKESKSVEDLFEDLFK